MPETKNNICTWRECAFEMPKKNFHKRSITFQDNFHQQTLMCTECYNLNGEIDLTYMAHADISGKGMDSDIFYTISNHIRDSLYIDGHMDLYCIKCGKRTNHLFIDSAIAPHIRLLNKMGVKTSFSCEGHGISLQRGIADTPYIAFRGRELSIYGTSAILGYRPSTQRISVMTVMVSI